MSPLDKQTPNQLIGLDKDRTFKDTKSVTFALNAIKDSHDGGSPEYQSEPGNLQVDFLPSGYTLIGHIYGQDNEIYLFSTDGLSSEIGVFKQDFYQTLVNADLNFSLDYPITGEYRVRFGCDRVIYWNDYLNRDRWFNRDKPEQFMTGGMFDPDKFDFNPAVTIPNIDLIEVIESGGNLQVGSYYFQLEYLDSGRNVVYKSDITPQTVIYDESQNAAYPTIDGAVNYPQFDASAGGVPPTNKSIHLQFTNVDTTFRFIRMKVGYQVTANQVMQAHIVGELIPITASTIDWIYVGFNPNSGDSLLDYTEMVIPQFSYSASYVMEQVQNRLVRANLKEVNRDYAEYQVHASSITTNWVAEESPTNLVELGNPKDPRTYWYKTNFCGDEVYALGIQYLHTDGTWSPAFHIPGRESTGLDTVLLTVVANGASPSGTQVWESDVEHLGLTIGQTVEKWKVFNTALVSSSQVATHPYSYKGVFGYYEADFNYPDIRDCENNLIWGPDIDTSDKVRFHKFPDRRLIPHLNDEDYIVQLGVEFTVPAYPNSDIVGHRFCHITRDEFNRTVTDSGWVANTYQDFDFGSSTYFLTLNARYGSELDNDIHPDGNREIVRFESPEVLFNSRLTNTSYLKVNEIYQHHSNIIEFADAVIDMTVNSFAVYSAIHYIDSISHQDATRTNYNIERSLLLEAGSTMPASTLGIEIRSRDFLTGDNVIQLSFPFEDLNTTFPLVGNNTSLTDVGDDGEFTFNNTYTYKKVVRNVYTNFLILPYQYIHFNPVYGPGVSEFYGGDTLITNMTTLRLAEISQEGYGDANNIATIWQSLHQDLHWVESDLASSLRYGGLDEPFNYFRKGDADLEFLHHFWNGDSGDLSIQPADTWIPEYYKLNVDYNLQDNEQSKVSLASDYDYCSSCQGLFTNRIVFSPVSFDEENVDLYRTTLVNDYIDMPGHRGAITGLKYRNNRLIVHCEDATFILQPNPQVIATDQSQAYLTTGDFLSIPPQELIQTDIGYAGCQNKQHQADSPRGHHWLDQRRGQVFSYDNQLEEISMIGLSQWFKENLPSETQRAVWDFNHEKYPFRNTTSDWGVGCIMYYDPRFKRLIISKTDYLPIGQVEDPVSGLYWNSAVNLWQVYDSFGVVTLTPVFSNFQRFENKSWTISFDFQRWISWHSYIPYQAFSDDYNFYSLSKVNLQPDYIYKHLEKTRYQNFYTTKYDFIVEYMVFDLGSDRLTGLHYQGYTYLWNTASDSWLQQDSTFDRLVAYNGNQSTGLQTLTLQNQVTNPYLNNKILAGTKYVVKTNQDYKISGLFDMSTGQPVNTKGWNLRRLHGGYIDQVVNTPNINLVKPQYQWSALWDKYVVVRFHFKPVEDYKKILILTETQEQISVR